MTVLFNLRTCICLVVEKWFAKLKGEDAVGTAVQSCLEGIAMMSWLTKCLLADDGALLSSTRSGAVCLPVR